jgi:hypothetical protein
LFVKVVLITIPAAIAGIAQSFDLARANHEVSSWTITGIGAALVTLLGAVFILWTESDSSEALEKAREALEAARAYEQERNDFETNIARLSKEVTRGLELYNITDVMRGAIEQSLDLPNASVAGILQTFLTATRDSLVAAFGHEPGDTWTTCIYEARQDPESGKVTLYCIAHERTVQCPLSEARAWQEGNGVVGLAYSRATMIAIPDMLDPALGSAFDLKDKARSYDHQRYRSMVAAPIIVGSASGPWGVVVATSNRPYHFREGPPDDGVPTTAPVRAIAAMASLAVRSLGRAAKAPAETITEPGRAGSIEPVEAIGTPTVAGHRPDAIKPEGNQGTRPPEGH